MRDMARACRISRLNRFPEWDGVRDPSPGSIAGFGLGDPESWRNPTLKPGGAELAGPFLTRKGSRLSCPLPSRNLQQFQNELLLLVSLGQSGDAGLLQNGKLGQASDCRRDVGSRDGVLR